MPPEPTTKRTVAFVDGQNLFHRAKAVFGYTHPNYDVMALAKAVCAAKGFELVQVRFYTGVPDQSDNPLWHAFWTNKLAAMRRTGIHVYSRSLRYHTERVPLPDGSTVPQRIGREKGIDVRIALDIVRLGYRGDYDVALLFSQDQDLSEVADEVRTLAAQQGRWLKIASAYPSSPSSTYNIGVDRTDWIPVDRETYDACIDPTDYRPKHSGGDP